MGLKRQDWEAVPDVYTPLKLQVFYMNVHTGAVMHF
jgi:hypothetical protein